jgi:anti-sigma B factor antagonist
MSFSFKTRTVDNVIIFDLTGQLTFGDAVASFRSAHAAEVAKGHLHYVINLGHVTHVDSAGLGELISTYVSDRKAHGNVVLLSLTARIRDLLQMTKLLTVFESFTDEVQAIEAAKIGAS